MANNKAVLGGVSAILLVAAVVAVVATVVVTRRHDNGAEITTSSKSVEAVCTNTDYKDDCVRTLGKALDGPSDPSTVLQAAVNATLDSVREAYESSVTIGQKITADFDKMAMRDCKKLFEDAMDDLRAVMELAKNESDWSKRQDDIKTWLSAVISQQSACLDGFNSTEVRDELDKAVEVAVKITSNALAIFKGFAKITHGFSDLNLTMPNRRLLSDEDGFPSWMSAGDRRLLGKKGKKGRKGKRGHRGARAIPIPRIVAPSASGGPNAVVAKDGSGQFTTITQAINAMPAAYPNRYVIHVKAGVYDEQVLIDRTKANIFMYGDGPGATIVTGKKSVAISKVTTSESATFAVEAPGFIATNMAFANTAGPEGEQAVALRVKGDKSAFFNCRIDGYQDTLYALAMRQFYRDCTISGTVDFIFGDSPTLIQNSVLLIRRPGHGQKNMVTAQGRRNPRQNTGIIIQNCQIVPDMDLFAERITVPTYLGRPWKAFSRTVIMESEIGDLIRPEGWFPWEGNNFLDTLYYAEYANRGPGANTDNRVKWPGYRVINRQEAEQYTAGVFIDYDNWVGTTGAGYTRGFTYN